MTPPIRTEKTSLRNELKIIHPAGWWIALAPLVFWVAYAAPRLAQTASDRPGELRVSLAMILFSLLALLLLVFFLLVFYVNADAKRRGMNRLAWTLLVIFVPQLIGFIIYFFLRKPILQSCPKCSVNVQGEFAFCPSCGERLSESCPACKRLIESGWARCAYCGAGLRGEVLNA